MKRNKGNGIFENATVQCQHCARYFIRPMPHLCPIQLRKRHQKWLYLNEMKPEDKLAEKILEKQVQVFTKEGFQYDEVPYIPKKDTIEAMYEYHEAKLKEELIKFLEWEGSNDIPKWVPLENIVDEYLKQRSK